VRALLISNSTEFGRGYLDHCADAIVLALGPAIRRVLFVPYALFDRDRYAATVRRRFEQLEFAVDSVHDAAGGPIRAIEQAEAIFIGGGNTFRLIDALWREQLIEPLRRRVAAGAPYIGASAGTNVACPSIRTTNDMPIVQPPTFEAIGLVPFQINPHYQDPPAGSTHMGETREQRIAEFHEENDVPVVGLREGAWLWLDGPSVALGGSSGARLFRRSSLTVDLLSGARLDYLLDPARAG
jgi:dipeptidase E